jgi:tetratricopeptide (TPR) repeat protein
MREHIEGLVPALRRLHDEGDTASALCLVEVIADLAGGTQSLQTAARLVAVAEALAWSPPGPALSCLGVARGIYFGEEFDHGMGACDVIAADILGVNDDEDRALDLYPQGLGLLDAEVDPALLGRAWHNLGILQLRGGDPDASLESQQQALEAYRLTGRASPTADCHVGIGIALESIGRHADALEPYAAARGLFLEFGENERLADVDDRRGLALCELGRYEESAAAHAAAITRYDTIEEPWCAARSRRYRSHPLDHAGRIDEALTALEAARGVLTAFGDEVEAARCDASSAAALLGLGQEAAARALLQRACGVLADNALDDEADWCERLIEDPSTLAHQHG